METQGGRNGREKIRSRREGKREKWEGGAVKGGGLKTFPEFIRVRRA